MDRHSVLMMASLGVLIISLFAILVASMLRAAARGVAEFGSVPEPDIVPETPVVPEERTCSMAVSPARLPIEIGREVFYLQNPRSGRPVRRRARITGSKLSRSYRELVSLTDGFGNRFSVPADRITMVL
ncbi:MAG: hypothetical protein LiPW15_680 [Parcubacteria group bacterium LiPW_15]|nr:MAG: hypothetical protein LiPW15_680 [Parcubacteria group bacterium LiPW_15]